MAERGEYRFEIQDLTPLTFSMGRLKDYIDPLLELFGYENNIHLMRIDEGSAVPCILADASIVTILERRFLAAKTGSGHKKVYRAIEDLNELLAEDHTSAVLVSPFQGNVIEFPGIKRAVDPLIGPITQHDNIQGEIVQIGGRDETISVHVRDDKETHICTTTREMGRELAQHLFQHVRLFGTAKWIRQANGKWKLITFTIEAPAIPLSNSGLKAALQELRELVPEGVDASKYLHDLNHEEMTDKEQ
jgi:hypothetical protein